MEESLQEQQEYIKLEFIELKQPIGNLYIAKIPYKDLLAISYADIRKIEHEGSFESYLGIQRELDPKRVIDLHQYVTLFDATFPTSIILSISNKKFASEYASYNVPIDNIFDDLEVLDQKFEEVKNIYIEVDPIDQRKKLFIRKQEKVAKVIDGQHRIEGLRNFTGGESQFDMNVTIFMDMDIEEQAIVFATINKAQTKVNKSRVYDLYDLAKSRSPLKTGHNIAKYLNLKNDSPFENLIKILGVADDAGETITQATFVECLMPYISKNPILDRDLELRGKTLPLPKPQELKRQIFRNLFIEKKDAEIAKNVYNYFNAIKRTWPIAWEGGEGLILNKSTGLVALFRFLSDVYLHLCKIPESNTVNVQKIGTVFSEAEYNSVIEPMRLEIEDLEFTPTNYLPGGSGRSQLYKRLKEVSKIIFDKKIAGSEP